MDQLRYLRPGDETEIDLSGDKRTPSTWFSQTGKSLRREFTSRTLGGKKFAVRLKDAPLRDGVLKALRAVSENPGAHFDGGVLARIDEAFKYFDAEPFERVNRSPLFKDDVEVVEAMLIALGSSPIAAEWAVIARSLGIPFKTPAEANASLCRLVAFELVDRDPPRPAETDESRAAREAVRQNVLLQVGLRRTERRLRTMPERRKAQHESAQLKSRRKQKKKSNCRCKNKKGKSRQKNERTRTVIQH